MCILSIVRNFGDIRILKGKIILDTAEELICHEKVLKSDYFDGNQTSLIVFFYSVWI